MMELLPEKIGQAEIMTVADGPDTFPGECGHWYSPAAVKKIVELAIKVDILPGLKAEVSRALL